MKALTPKTINWSKCPVCSAQLTSNHLRPNNEYAPAKCSALKNWYYNARFGHYGRPVECILTFIEWILTVTFALAMLLIGVLLLGALIWLFWSGALLRFVWDGNKMWLIVPVAGFVAWMSLFQIMDWVERRKHIRVANCPHNFLKEMQYQFAYLMVSKDYDYADPGMDYMLQRAIIFLCDHGQVMPHAQTTGYGTFVAQVERPNVETAMKNLKKMFWLLASHADLAAHFDMICKSYEVNVHDLDRIWASEVEAQKAEIVRIAESETVREREASRKQEAARQREGAVRSSYREECQESAEREAADQECERAYEEWSRKIREDADAVWRRWDNPEQRAIDDREREREQRQRDNNPNNMNQW